VSGAEFLCGRTWQRRREEIIIWEKNLSLRFPDQICHFYVIGQFYFTKRKPLLACKLQTSLTSFELPNSEAFCSAFQLCFDYDDFERTVF